MTGLRRVGPDRGSAMAAEVVILTPVLVGFILLVVAFGRYVTVRGDVEAVARDAVRAASLERTTAAAGAAASSSVRAAELPGTCSDATLQGRFVAGGTITVSVSCQVPLDDLGLVGLPGAVTVEGTSAAPLDLYRRTG